MYRALQITIRLVLPWKSGRRRGINLGLMARRINGTSSTMSDLDLFIITENPNFFKTVNRGGKILESIKAGFKKSSGMDLDINVMTNQEYNRAKSGELKTSTQKYKENIIVK